MRAKGFTGLASLKGAVETASDEELRLLAGLGLVGWLGRFPLQPHTPEPEQRAGPGVGEPVMPSAALPGARSHTRFAAGLTRVGSIR